MLSVRETMRLCLIAVPVLLLLGFPAYADEPEAPAPTHSEPIIVRRFAASIRIVALDPSLGFSLDRRRPGVPADRRAASLARATAFVLAETVTEQLRGLGYNAVQSDDAGPEPDGRALIVSGAFRSINEGHRRRLAGKDASVAISVVIDSQMHGEKPQRLKVFQLDSRRIPQQSGRHAEAGVNSAARELGFVIADAAAELADRNSWPRRHADRAVQVHSQGPKPKASTGMT